MTKWVGFGLSGLGEVGWVKWVGLSGWIYT